MHPEFFTIPIPEFLQGFLPDSITIYGYGFFIAMGAIVGFAYLGSQLKKEYKMPFDVSINLLTIIIVLAFLGGKIFLIFEKPGYYMSDLSRLLKGNGFVFYGSLIFAVTGVYFFLKKNKLPVLPVLDHIAITTGIAHLFGRLGCFMAGCCYGVQTEGPLGVIFTDPSSAAKPLHVALHPTQLYSATMLAFILAVSWVVLRNKKFHSQVFLIYIGMYSIGRAIIEIYRGDEIRGYIIGDWLSHSQFISLILLGLVLWAYTKLRRSPLAKIQ